MNIKVKFTSTLDVREVDDNTWKLLKPFTADITGDVQKTLCVPNGFVTDFASVPRLPFVYLVAGDTAHKSATLHDWLYSKGSGETNREFADCVFYSAMLADGVNASIALSMYYAVRTFGKSHWKIKA